MINNPLLHKITILTVVRNAVNTLEKAIQSVVSQNYPNLEYIIIDGGSTDGTVDIIKKHAAYLTYWQSKPDGGAGFAQNIGLEQATGDIVAFLFADDWYSPGLLHAINEAYVENPQADIVTCGYRIVMSNSRNNFYVQREYLHPTAIELNLHNLFFSLPLTGSRFIRKPFIDRIGHFIAQDNQGNYIYSNDTELLLRAFLQGAHNVNINLVGYNFLIHQKSATSNRHMPTIKRIRREHIAISEKYLRQKNLTREQYKLFVRWRSDQWVRLMFCEFYTGNFSVGIKTILVGIKRCGINWLLYFITVPILVLRNRIRYFLASCYSRFKDYSSNFTP